MLENIFGKNKQLEKTRKFYEKLPLIEKERTLNDLRNVGINKALGYLAKDIINACGIDPEEIKKELKERGICVVELNGRDTNIYSGAVYVYDLNMLKEILERNKSILEEHNWPTEPESFIKNLKRQAPSNTKLFDIIADAFGDKNNSGRTNMTHMPK